jgi:hypothetical protein
VEALSVARWEVSRMLRRYGWKPFAGIALLAAAAGLELHTMSWEKRRAEATVRLAELERVPAAMPVLDPLLSTRTRLKAFVDSLPESKESSATIKQLFTIAQRSGVSLAQGEYRALPDPAAHLVRYQISLPVKGEARRIHTFVVDALNEIRPLTLEGLSLKREKVMSREADVQIRFMLVARP